MEPVEALLVVAALLVCLVAGFLIAFALIVMPGIGRLGDGEFVRAFQEMDAIIQRRNPLFMLLWVGSVGALVASAVFAWPDFDGVGRLLLGLAMLLYLGGVQLPTATINIPLNNQIQAVDPAGPAVERARSAFEARWNRWNLARTAVACVVAVLLLALVARS